MVTIKYKEGTGVSIYQFFVTTHPNGVVLVSDDETKEYLKTFGIPEGRISVVGKTPPNELEIKIMRIIGQQACQIITMEEAARKIVLLFKEGKNEL